MRLAKREGVNAVVPHDTTHFWRQTESQDGRVFIWRRLKEVKYAGYDYMRDQENLEVHVAVHNSPAVEAVGAAAKAGKAKTVAGHEGNALRAGEKVEGGHEIRRPSHAGDAASMHQQQSVAATQIAAIQRGNHARTALEQQRNGPRSQAPVALASVAAGGSATEVAATTPIATSQCESIACSRPRAIWTPDLREPSSSALPVVRPDASAGGDGRSSPANHTSQLHYQVVSLPRPRSSPTGRMYASKAHPHVPQQPGVPLAHDVDDYVRASLPWRPPSPSTAVAEIESSVGMSYDGQLQRSVGMSYDGQLQRPQSSLAAHDGLMQRHQYRHSASTHSAHPSRRRPTTAHPLRQSASLPGLSVLGQSCAVTEGSQGGMESPVAGPSADPGLSPTQQSPRLAGPTLAHSLAVARSMAQMEYIRQPSRPASAYRLAPPSPPPRVDPPVSHSRLAMMRTYQLVTPEVTARDLETRRSAKSDKVAAFQNETATNRQYVNAYRSALATGDVSAARRELRELALSRHRTVSRSSSASGILTGGGAGAGTDAHAALCDAQAPMQWSESPYSGWLEPGGGMHVITDEGQGAVMGEVRRPSSPKPRWGPCTYAF